MPYQSAFEQKVRTRKAKVGIIGLGYVGLPLAVEFCKARFPVLGVDLDRERVKAVHAGESYIADVPESLLRKFVKMGRLLATTNYALLKTCDAILICVPTPLSKTREPDISYIVSSVTQLAKFIKPGQLVVLESTTYPGTTEELVAPLLTENGKWRHENGTTGEPARPKIGADLFVGFSPERVDPGNPHFTIHNTPKVVSGLTPACAELTKLLYTQICEKVVPVSSPRAAELSKLLENTYRAVNIGLANEMALIAERLGVNIWEVIAAASTKPFGFQAFYPGPGLGGHCIPVDPLYLSWKMKRLNYNPKFLKLADDINARMPEYLIDRMKRILKSGPPGGRGSRRKPRTLRRARIILLGIAYKRDVADARESPALDLINLLHSKGCDAVYHDPYLPTVEYAGRTLRSVAWKPSTLRKYDLVVITTNHTFYPWRTVVQYSRRIFDTRNAIPFDSSKVVKL
ncbi:MAG: nucleotide sugar dehydrogenase [bacterium]